MLPKPFKYLRPDTLDAALAELAGRGDGAAPYAGGTELLLLLKMRLTEYDFLIDLKRIPELGEVTLRDSTLYIGAMATHAAISANADVIRAAPALAKLCGSIANPRVRSSGTLGGNLCFAEPTADPPTLLAALNAKLHLASARGRRTVAADQFVTGALETERAEDEILLQIEVPPGGQVAAYERQLNGHRSLVGAAASIPAETNARPRIWLGCLAERPVALEQAEDFILASTGPLNVGGLKEVIDADISKFDVADDEHAGADYRCHVASVITLRAIAAAATASGREVMP